MKNSEILKEFSKSTNRIKKVTIGFRETVEIEDPDAHVWLDSRQPDGTRRYHVAFAPEADRASLRKRLLDLAALHDWSVTEGQDGTMLVIFLEDGGTDEERAARMKVTRTFRVYGVEGHRQREAFKPSYDFELKNTEIPVRFSVRNSDKTGTQAYSEVAVSSVSAAHIEKELFAQVEDGIFENSRTGEIVEVIDGKEAKFEFNF